MAINLFDLPLWAKFTIAIVYDVADLFSLPIAGQLYDVFGTGLGLALWGLPGGTQIWEVLDPVDAVDRFVPTVTLVGIYVTFLGGK